MTVDDVREQIEYIRREAADVEAAHGMEAELYIDVLGEIANGADNPERLAAEALKALEIEFYRWQS